MKKLAEKNICPFQNACTIYDEKETKEAAKRVANLLMEHIQEETQYKKAIRNFLLSDNNNNSSNGP